MMYQSIKYQIFELLMFMTDGSSTITQHFLANYETAQLQRDL